ncbi:MAG: aminoacetone oxidase family FAD-binding enzyme, partial [Bacteroidota bacterium]
MKRVIIVGGGASGYFAAINAKEANPEAKITILEKGKQVLQKVKISGGGRCNVTHACFDGRELSKNYPRGERALLGAFSRFQAGDTIGWFADRGVELKIEDDGRMFPTTDRSETIISCFQNRAHRLGVEVQKGEGVTDLIPPTEKQKAWRVVTKSKAYEAKKVVLATGSSPQMWRVLGRLGYKIETPIPSLFTFKIDDPRLNGLAGVSMPHVQASVPDTPLAEDGALLITHWGLSAPSILRLSAWGAKILNAKNYHFWLRINFIPTESLESVRDELFELKDSIPKKQVA